MTNSIASTPPFIGLEPAAVWAHFQTLCQIPRQSKQEAALREHLQQWAAAKGLATVVDAAGNLIIRKAASQGCEGVPGTILQAHLDMVCQKNSGTQHDFARDPIRPVCRDGWLVAENTTLGADNGIGVALILAALEDTTLVHGPLEALLTVDEEDGMGGAQGLVAGMLQGSLLLNLDTEAWGEFYLGCAGGLDVNVRHSGTAEALPSGWVTRRIELQGLRGGHSGIDIHEGRGNAIKLLVRLLCDLTPKLGLRLAEFSGGSARNALPREARALVALAPEQAAALDAALAKWQACYRTELSGIDEAVTITSSAAEATQVMAALDQAVWLNTLHAAPYGVKRMSVGLPGVVETSNNLGIVNLTPSQGSCNFMARSSMDSACNALADEILSLCSLASLQAEKSGYYPGWQPNAASPLLALSQRVYQREFGQVAKTQVIHAGLECGIIGAKYPGLDMISFGPTIRSPHAPGEAVEIASVAQTWQLLCAILAEIH